MKKGDCLNLNSVPTCGLRNCGRLTIKTMTSGSQASLRWADTVKY